jgi:hypothetical protein
MTKHVPRKQANTRKASIKSIMRQPMFAAGLESIRNGRPFDPDVDHWGYERGRLFGAIAPLSMPLRVDGKINPKALRLCEAAFARRLVI